MRFTSEPHSESGVRRQHFELFFEYRQPGGDQVKILQADPFASLSSVFDSLDSDIILTTTHGKFVVRSSANSLFSICLQLLRGIRAWGNNEEDRLSGG